MFTFMAGAITTGAWVARNKVERKSSASPLANFARDISSDERADLAPFAQFSTDLAQDKLPNYSFLVPNLYDDGHSIKGTNGGNQGNARCGDASALKQTDDWLRDILGPLLQSKTFKDKGMLVVTYDEASGDDQSDGAGHWGGGRVATIIVSSQVKSGYRSIALYHHESVLRLMLEALGLDRNDWPGSAKDAPSMSEFFGK